jgi:protein TonB
MMNPESALATLDSGSEAGPRPPAQQMVYDVGGAVSAPKAVFAPDATYTTEARRAKLQGTCALELIVEPDGRTGDIHVTRSLGGGLDEKAVEAIQQWRFQPAMKAGQPVAARITAEVTFRVY